MSGLQVRVHARRQAAELGLPWPGSDSAARDLLDDAAATGGSIRITACGNGGLVDTTPWTVLSVADCAGDRCWNDGNCIAVVDLRGRFEAFGQHIPGDAALEVAG